MKTFLVTIKVPIVIAIANVFPGNLLYSFLPGSIGLIAFNIVRALNIFYAGWLVAANYKGARMAAFAGPLLLLIDHVILKGGYFFVAQIINPSSVENQGYLAFIGVLGSYVLFLPFTVFIGFGGWYLQKKSIRNKLDL